MQVIVVVVVVVVVVGVVGVVAFGVLAWSEGPETVA